MPSHEVSSESVRLADRYAIIALVGAGAMGRVYKAVDLELDEIVAVKVLAHALVEHPGMVERFRREVKLARRVTHENVARVFDIGEHGQEKFLTMEFVEGMSLGRLLEDTGPPPLARTLEIARAVCAGLSAAHAAGVVHRDLKPDNILLDRAGRVVITDFGIARALHSMGTATQTTGLVVGTPAYMAPEQAQGSPNIGPAADIYALGAMLYELLTGELPWRGDSPMAVALARLTHPPPDPAAKNPRLPKEIAAVVRRCMAREQEQRYPSVAAVVEALAAASLDVPQPPELRPSIVPEATLRVPPVRDLAEAATALPGALQAIAMPRSADTMLAVLPFTNAGAQGDEHLADGLTEDVIDTLSTTRGLRVRSPGTVARFKGKGGDTRAVGAELQVDVVAEGSVQRVGEHVRVRARLIEVAGGYQLWAQRFDCSAGDLLSVSDEVAKAIARALAVDVHAPDRVTHLDAEAVELYLRGRAAFRGFFGTGHIDEAVDLLEKAVARAPNSATILASYAMARARRWYVTGEGAAAALETAQQAVTAGPELGEPWLALALVHYYSSDSEAAMRHAKRAARLAPGLPEAHFLLGRLLVECGLVKPGLERLEAVGTIDPNLVLASSDLWRVYALIGDWAKADALLDSAGSDPRAILDRARCALWRGDLETVRGQLRVILESPTSPAIAMAKSIFEMVSDDTTPSRRKQARETMGFGRGTPRRAAFQSQLEAEHAAMKGRKDDALGFLEKGTASGLLDLLWLDGCPLFEELRQEPRFAKVRAEVYERASRVIAVFHGADR